jgi:hypothetical protein
MSEIFQRKLKRVQAFSLAVGAIALALSAAGAFSGNARRFFISYLFGYLFWLGLSLGCLAVAMIHHLTGGAWGNVTRRFLEAGFMTLPLMALLFVPIFFGLHELYPWMQAHAMDADKVVRQKAIYLNAPGFIGRAIFFFLVWNVMAFCLRKWSLEQDQTKDVNLTRKLRALSGPGVVIYAMTVTFAYIDWVMSLEPDWYSTVFLVIVCIGQILVAYAFSILMLAWFRKEPPISTIVETKHFHQLGNLLLTFVMFWTYVAFGQLLIIWAGNLPHEINWYQHRIAGHWKWIVGVLVIFHFFLPFFILLFRSAKQRVVSLAILAAMVFVAHIFEGYWLILPSFFTHGLQVSWLDFTAPIGVGGIWFGFFITLLSGGGLVPRNDPRVELSPAYAQ